jgi:hypothetical protein
MRCEKCADWLEWECKELSEWGYDSGFIIRFRDRQEMRGCQCGANDAQLAGSEKTSNVSGVAATAIVGNASHVDSSPRRGGGVFSKIGNMNE